MPSKPALVNELCYLSLLLEEVEKLLLHFWPFWMVRPVSILTILQLLIDSLTGLPPPTNCSKWDYEVISGFLEGWALVGRCDYTRVKRLAVTITRSVTWRWYLCLWDLVEAKEAKNFNLPLSWITSFDTANGGRGSVGLIVAKYALSLSPGPFAGLA